MAAPLLAWGGLLALGAPGVVASAQGQLAGTASAILALAVAALLVATLGAVVMLGAHLAAPRVEARRPQLARALAVLALATGWCVPVLALPALPPLTEIPETLTALWVALGAVSFAVVGARVRAAWSTVIALTIALHVAVFVAAGAGAGVPAWAGPVWALVGAAALALAGRSAALDARLAPRALAGAGYLTLALAVGFALATARPLNAGAAASDTLRVALLRLGELEPGLPALGLTLVLVAVGIAARPLTVSRDGPAWALVLAGLLAGLALLVARPLRSAVLAAPGLVGLAIVVWLVARRWPARLRPLRLSADGLLLGTYALVFALVASPADFPADAPPWALAAVLLAAVFGIGRALAEQSGVGTVHAQVAAVGAYAVFRPFYAPTLDPGWDAIAALLLAFALVGVAVLTRRAGARPVAAAVRRFAALLPIAAELLVQANPCLLGATPQAVAAGGALVYLAFALAEHSRAFGALATLAAQLAFLLANRDGDLAPLNAALPGALGAILLVVGQLYAGSLGRPARQAVRLLGGLLLFAPGAAEITARLGEGDGRFALVFGGLCLVGVLAGTLLRMRAYLFLGAAFLLFDIGVHVGRAGLQDRRLGFILMTVLGLGILGGMAWLTLRREQAQRWAAAARRTLGAWD